MSNCSAPKPLKVLKNPMALYAFVSAECAPTHLEIVVHPSAVDPSFAWRARVYEHGEALVFVRETRPSRYEVHRVESMVGVRLAA